MLADRLIRLEQDGIISCEVRDARRRGHLRDGSAAPL